MCDTSSQAVRLNACASRWYPSPALGKAEDRMTKDEAVTMLLDRLGLSVTADGEAQVAECRSILADALALQEQLPTSWYEVWDLIEALEQRLAGELANPPYDFWLIYGPLNQAVNTRNVTFPRELW
jgi:hypothetical protein